MRIKWVFTRSQSPNVVKNVKSFWITKYHVLQIRKVSNSLSFPRLMAMSSGLPSSKKPGPRFTAATKESSMGKHTKLSEICLVHQQKNSRPKVKTYWRNL